MFYGATKVGMTRFSRTLSLLMILFLLMGGLISGNLLVSHSTSASSGYRLYNSEVFNPYGQFLVNDTLFASSGTNQLLTSVTFGYPSNYTGNIYSISAGYFIGNAHYTASTSSVVQNKTLLVTLNLPQQIPAGAEANVSLGFYVLNTYTPLTSTNYLVPMLFYPSVNVNLDNVSSKLQFPYQTTAPTTNPFKFATFVGGSPLIEDWTYSSSNVTSVTPQWAEVPLNSSQSDTGYVDFQSIQRTISVDASGNALVTDYVTIKNLGLNTLTSLAFNLLTNSSTVEAVPSAEPPLSNVQPMSIVGGEMNLGGINRQVEPNDAVTVILQYNLGSQYWNYSSGTYSISIPKGAPVSALVDKFLLNYNIPNDYVVTNLPATLDLSNSAGLQGNSIVSYRRGVGSAFGFALPASSFLFIAVFLGVLALRPRRESEEDVESTIESMVKAIEEKVSGTNDILSELKGKGESISRNDVLATRARVEELRTKTAARFSSLRSQLGQTSLEVQSDMDKVASNDKELDRAVKDLLSNYDQYVSKKMRADSLSKVTQNNERRIQHYANIVLDTLHDLQSEYEK